MYSLSIKNTAGEMFDLSSDKGFIIYDIQNMNYPPTTVNTSSSADGKTYNSSTVNERNIVITIGLKGNIEQNRQKLYRMFPLKTVCTLYFGSRYKGVKIEGYVETLEVPFFVLREKAQVSFLCPSPWLESVTPEDFIPSYSVPLFSAPFAIEEGEPIPVSEVVDHPTSLIVNSGDVECGFAAEVTFSGAVTGLRFANETAGTWFKLDYSFAAGDKLTLDTRRGRLAVKVIRGTTVTNLLRYMVSGSRWLKLAVGANRLGVTADSGIDNAAVTISVYKLFGGV